jgi:peptidoglycan/xylan/chitin deacetylase (PgdA/CDA1 family)
MKDFFLYRNYSLFGINIKFDVSKRKVCNSITIFTYHQVSHTLDAKYNNLGNFTELHFFDAQMLWLNKNYKVISLAEAIKRSNENEIDDKYACITFDDGDKSILHAMQILEKHNIPGTFFINSGYLDNKMACWFHIYQFMKNMPKYNKYLNEDIENNIKYLRGTNDIELYNVYSKKIENLYNYIESEFNMFVSFNDLKNINSNLFHVGLHGHEHQRFSMKAKEWQKENIKKDIEFLSVLESYRPIFAIPFGRPHDWNVDTVKILFELDLDFVYADGGINLHRAIGYQRIPSDGRVLKEIIKKEKV